MFISFCDSVPGDSLVFHQHIEAPYVFDWEHGMALHPMQVIRASSPAEGISQRSSRVAAETWGLFSSYSGYGHSKLHFVQRSEYSCLLMMDTSGI